MSQYENFAYIYDHLMEDVNYDQWLAFIHQTLSMRGVKSICDLGCGTGNMTIPMSKLGYDMIGVDLSYDMLMVAREKADDEGEDILFLNQDMKEFELYGTVDAIVATCDSVNYLKPDDLDVFLKWVNNYLNPEGTFVFDLNTEYKFKHVYGKQTFSELGSDFAYLWENHYRDQSKVNEYYISFFVEEEDGSYSRSDEYHKEYVHNDENMKRLLETYGFKIIGIYDDYTNKPCHSETTRMTYIVQKTRNNESR